MIFQPYFGLNWQSGFRDEDFWKGLEQRMMDSQSSSGPKVIKQINISW
jgi:hypothetical protein